MAKRSSQYDDRSDSAGKTMMVEYSKDAQGVKIADRTSLEAQAVRIEVQKNQLRSY